MTGIDLTRRELLLAAGGAGATGAVVGTGAAALIADEELLPSNFLVSGTLDLLVEWGDDNTSEGTAPVVIDSPTGAVTFSVGLPGGRNNPAFGWFRTVCPRSPLPTFADDVHVTLSYVGCDGGDTVIATGSLDEVGNELRGGIPLDPGCTEPDDLSPGDQSCLQPGDDGGVDLRFEWDWDLDEDCDTDGQRLLTFQFVGEQCRHDESPESPFPDPGSVPRCVTPDERYAISYVELAADAGDGCELVGKLELEDEYCGQTGGLGDSFLAPGRYDLYDDGDDCNDTGYDLRVTDTRTKDCGNETVALAFELLDDEGEPHPDLCSVRIKGGPGEAVYDSGFDGNATGGLLYAPKKGGNR